MIQSLPTKQTILHLLTFHADAYSGASSEDEGEAGNGNVIQSTTGSIDENSHADESPNGDICPVSDKTVPGMTTIKEDQESDDSGMKITPNIPMNLNMPLIPLCIFSWN